MIKFNDFYNLATSTHAGIYEVDDANNLRLGNNGAELSVRVHDTLLRSLNGEGATRPEVQQVMAEINALKEQNTSISTRDVRKWQREMQSYISFGAECVAGIQVKENTGKPISSNQMLSSAVVALDWGKTNARDPDDGMEGQYRAHLNMAYDKFAGNSGNTPEEQNGGDYNDQALALSGKLIAGSRLGKDSGGLRKDYEELVKVLGSCKAGSGLSREVLGLASEAIDVYTVKTATDDSFFEKDLLVLETRAHLRLQESRNPKNNPQLRLLQLKYGIKNKCNGLGVPDDDGYRLEAGRTHAEGAPYGNLHIRSRLKPLLAPRSQGKWKKIKNFFHPRGAIKEKQRVTNELRRLCEESGMYEPELLKEFWDDDYRWSAVFGGRVNSLVDRDPFARMTVAERNTMENLGRLPAGVRIKKAKDKDRVCHGFVYLDDDKFLDQSRTKRLLHKIFPRLKLINTDRTGIYNGREIRRDRYYRWIDVRKTGKPWQLSEVDTVLASLDAHVASQPARRTKAYRELLLGEQSTPFPAKKSQYSQGYSVPELLARGQVGIPEFDSGACMYTLGNDTFLLPPADVEAIAGQILAVVLEKEAEFNSKKREGFYLKRREQEFFSGQRSHRIHEQNSEEAFKISHSYALKKMYNHWLAYGPHSSSEYALNRANELRDRDSRIDYTKLRVLDGVEISVYDKPYSEEFKKALREQLEELPEEGLKGASNVLEILRDVSPPHNAEKVFSRIYDDKIRVAVDRALQQVQRTAYADRASKFPVQVREEAGMGREEYATGRQTRMKLYLDKLPPQVVNSDVFKASISDRLNGHMHAYVHQYDESCPLGERLESMLFTHNEAVAIVADCNEQEALRSRDAGSDKLLARPITVNEMQSILRDVRKLSEGLTDTDRQEEERITSLALYSDILDQMKPEVQNITDNPDAIAGSFASLYDQVADRVQKEITPGGVTRVGALDPLFEDLESRAPSPEIDPETTMVPNERLLTPEIRPVVLPPRSVTDSDDHLSLGLSSFPEVDRASLTESAGSATSSTRSFQSATSLTESVRSATPLTVDGNHENSLKNDLLALKFFLGLPRNISGDLPEKKRDAIRCLVDVGDVMFPEELFGVEQWFGEASQGVDDPRVKVALDVAKFYASNFDLGGRLGLILSISSGSGKKLNEAVERRPASMDMKNTEFGGGASVRLPGSSNVGEIPWGAVTDLVSEEAEIYVRQFFQGSPGGMRVGIDENHLARHVGQLRAFMSARYLKNNPPTHRDIQKQLQKQVGMLPGADSLDVGLSQMSPMASPKVNSVEFQNKYYLPELNRLRGHASQNSVLLNELRGKVPKGAQALRLNSSDEELKLCFLRVLPLAIAAAEREARRAHAKEVDPASRDQMIRHFVGKAIWSRHVRENELAHT